MDVYLSEEALQTLSATKLVLSASNTDGLLIGHKRGNLFFVEKAFPSQKGFFPSTEKFFSLNEVFNNRLLGFYSFDEDESKTKKILAPFAFGKLYLKIKPDQTEHLIIKAFRIDFKKDFHLSPIRLKSKQQKGL